jgi:membrane associated rhomboid family serine protease
MVMGIQDRDYYRDGPSFFDRVGQQGATVWLIAITCGIFFGQYVPGSPFLELGAYVPRLILEGEVWRLLTPLFLHGGLFHLFFNMLTLYWAGSRLEEVYGPREFAVFYLLSGIGANVFYLALQLAGVTPMASAIGASGAVTATLILFACHFPHAQVRLWFFLPMPVWLLAVLFVGFTAFAGLNHDPNARGGGIAHFAHLGGAVCGFLYFQTGIRFTALFPRPEAARVRPRLRVHSPPVEEADEPEPVAVPAQVPAAARPAGAHDEQLEAKLDAVLEKVAKHGQESLTPEEREILFKASELYKKRRK